MNTRYVVEYCDGFLWEELYHFDSLKQARVELEKLKKSKNGTKYRIVYQQWEVVE